MNVLQAQFIEHKDGANNDGSNKQADNDRRAPGILRTCPGEAEQ